MRRMEGINGKGAEAKPQQARLSKECLELQRPKDMRGAIRIGQLIRTSASSRVDASVAVGVYKLSIEQGSASNSSANSRLNMRFLC